jgi:hypothetical protein
MNKVVPYIVSDPIMIQLHAVAVLLPVLNDEQSWPLYSPTLDYGLLFAVAMLIPVLADEKSYPLRSSRTD